MADELKQHGLYKMPREVMQFALAGMGYTEAEYREKLKQQLERDARHAAMDARGEQVHGWSTKKPNPGWSDESVIGEVIVSPGSPVAPTR